MRSIENLPCGRTFSIEALFAHYAAERFYFYRYYASQYQCPSHNGCRGKLFAAGQDRCQQRDDRLQGKNEGGARGRSELLRPGLCRKGDGGAENPCHQQRGNHGLTPRRFGRLYQQGNAKQNGGAGPRLQPMQENYDFAAVEAEAGPVVAHFYGGQLAA